MKKFEIKKISIKSAFKVTLYLCSIPLALMSLIGIIISIIGVVIKEYTMLFFGIPYIIMPIIMVFLYGLFGMLGALIYNVLSRKFGGLELEIEDKND